VPQRGERPQSLPNGDPDELQQEQGWPCRERVRDGRADERAAQAQPKQLTLCWAAWDPANALVELSKDFTAKTGIQMKYEFVPWPNFAQRMLNELNPRARCATC
jgi:hypothetical protein